MFCMVIYKCLFSLLHVLFFFVPGLPFLSLFHALFFFFMFSLLKNVISCPHFQGPTQSAVLRPYRIQLCLPVSASGIGRLGCFQFLAIENDAAVTLSKLIFF